MKNTSHVRFVIAAFTAFTPFLCAMLFADIIEVSDAGRMFVSSGAAFKTVFDAVVKAALEL